jgi:HAD superfamily hydrolase (TIGR01509 family)
MIFDFDGTILDSETPEFESHRRFFGDHGVQLTEDEWCAGVGIAQPATEWWEWLCARAAAPPSFEAFREATLRYFREHVRMEPMPGIAALVGALVAAGVPRAIASSGTSEWVHRAVGELGLAPSFDAIVTGDQVGHGKPAPDVYLEAARRLEIPARHCVAVEDSGPGVAAARAAGMRVVAIPHPVSRMHDFSGADLQISSAADLTLDTLRRLAAVGRRPNGSEKITGG